MIGIPCDNLSMSLALTPAGYATLDYLVEHASQGISSMPWDVTPAGRSDDNEQRIAYADLSKHGLIAGHFTEGRRSAYPSFVRTHTERYPVREAVAASPHVAMRRRAL